mmetsp:Transcript_17313/g.42572  ORF Transcript_17313/g.42572 Transcript_17313/m.42572 type:complete len:602 (+) Transcript_17313:152-1957(+)
MRLEMQHLVERLEKSKARLVEIEEEKASTIRAQEEERVKQLQHVQRIKDSIEERKEEANRLQKEYTALVAKGTEEERALRHELETSRRLNATQASEEHRVLSSQAHKLDLRTAHEESKVDRDRMTADAELTATKIETSKAEIARLDSLIPVAGRADAITDAGQASLPLVVLEALRQHPIKRELQREGWLAAQSLLMARPAEEPARIMREAGAVALVLTAMKVHEDHAEVLANCIGFAWKLGFCDPPSRAQLIDVGLQHLCLRALAVLTGSASVVGGHKTLQQMQLLTYNICGALRMLLGVENSDLEEPPPPAPVAALAGDATPGDKASSLPRRGAPGGGLPALRRSPKLRGVPVIKSAPLLSRSHVLSTASLPGTGGAGSRQRQKPPSTSASNAVAPTGSNSTQKGNESGSSDQATIAHVAITRQCVILACKAMRDHRDSAFTQEAGIGALRTIVQDDARCATLLSQIGGVQLIMQAMQAHPEHTAVNLAALRALHVLAVDQHVHEQFKQTPELEVTIKEAERHHMHNSEMLTLTMQVLTQLPRKHHERQLQQSPVLTSGSTAPAARLSTSTSTPPGAPLMTRAATATPPARATSSAIAAL